MPFKSLLALSIFCNPVMAMITDVTETQGQQASPSPVIAPTSPRASFKAEDTYQDIPEHERQKVKDKIALLNKGFNSPTEMLPLLAELGAQLTSKPSPYDRLGDLRCDLLEWVYNATKEKDFERVHMIGESLRPLLSSHMTGHQRLGLLKILKGGDISELPSLTTPFRDLFQSTPLRDDQYAGCVLAMKALPLNARTEVAAREIVSYFNAPQHLGILQICEDHISALSQVQDRNLIDVLRETNTHITPDMNGFNRKKVLLKVIRGESFEEATTEDR